MSCSELLRAAQGAGDAHYTLRKGGLVIEYLSPVFQSGTSLNSDGLLKFSKILKIAAHAGYESRL